MPYSDNKNLVSIGIPFYNSAGFLKDAIRSVFAQTYNEWELLLVDDGSNDNSLTIANLINDPRVRVFSDGKHQGLISRLNQIIGLSSGKYLARMDADDIMHPQRLAQQVGYMISNPQIDVVGTAMYSLGQAYSIIGKRSAQPQAKNSSQERVKGFIHVSVLAKKEWFVAHKYDQGFERAEDQELWARTYRVSNFAELKIPLMYVREIDSVTLSKYAQSARSMRRIFLSYGRKEEGLIVSLWKVFLSYLKVFLYAIFGAIGIQDNLVKVRNFPLSQDEKSTADQGIKMVLNTAVKGWE